MKGQVQAYRGLRMGTRTTLAQESTYCSNDPQRETRVSMYQKPIKGIMKHRTQGETCRLMRGAEMRSLPDPKWEDSEGNN